MPEVLYKGIEWRRRLTGSSSLTGKTVKLQVRARGVDEVLVEISSGSGITHDGDEADAVISVVAQAPLQANTNYVFVVLCDDQPARAPDFLEVQSLS